MKQVPIRDARNALTSLVYEVEDGKPVRLTRHGKPVAVLMSDSQFLRLRARRSGARLESHGKPPPFRDGQIAAIAAVNGRATPTTSGRFAACGWRTGSRPEPARDERRGHPPRIAT